MSPRDADSSNADAMETVGRMGGMMGGAGIGAGMALWIFLGLALAAVGGVMAVRVLSASRRTRLPRLNQAESPAVRQAKDALRVRYAKGEISREDYLQGKVELED